MTTAIEALANYYNSLNNQEKVQFQQETGFSGVPIGIMSAKFAENYCKTHNITYNDNNVWGLYNKGKAEYEQATQAYNKCEAAYQASKSQLKNAENERNVLIAQYYAQNGSEKEISFNAKSQIDRKTGYTTYQKQTTQYDSLLSSLLDVRRMAVDTQRNGLNLGSIMTAKSNISEA